MIASVLMAMVKVLFLYLAVWGSIVNVMKFKRGHTVPSTNLILQSVGITGFIVLQWLI